ncbi:MAG TPA: hypothetical protein VEU47_11840 [Candidatus Cybelea sp.]|nr:hypothetical protein [Candidatus Cybelea sp.]
MPSNGHAPAGAGAVLALHRRDSAACVDPPAAADAAPPDETPLEYMLRTLVLPTHLLVVVASSWVITRHAPGGSGWPISADGVSAA